MLPDENASMRSESQPKNMRSCESTGLHSGQLGRRFTMASVKRIRFLNFLQALGSGFYPEGVENTSIDSIMFKRASDVAPQSKDRKQRQKLVRLLSISDRLKV